jgi:hypothetical protein
VQPTSSGVLRLESSGDSEALKRYLNPSGSAVEPREVLSSAKFIHWSSHSQAHRDLQVKIGIDTAREKLRIANSKMGGALNGRSDKVCFVVFDILHQGRGTYVAMKNILQNNSGPAAYEKLLGIGAADYAPRIATVRAEVAKLEATGHFGTRKYVAANNDFAS